MAALKKRKFIIVAAIILVMSIVLSSFIYLNVQKPYNGEIESITLALNPNQINSLIYIAQTQRYFDSNGLSVNIKNYSSITLANNAMLNGEAEITTASEFVLAQKALTNTNIQTIGTLDKLLQVSIIGRKDRGVETISDLEGKKIGVFLGSISEFYLGRFLELKGINADQVTLVDTSTSNIVDTFVNGTVDALITGQPNINIIKDIMGDQIVIFPAQSDQPAYFGILSQSSWVISHPETVVKFLKSLQQAETYMINNVNNAKMIIQTQLNLSDVYMAEVWFDHILSLSLDQSLILAMQDESRWLIQNNLTNATAVPNFTTYVYIDGLEAVKPASVTIIR